LAHGLGWSVSTLFELSAQNFLGGYVVALIAGARLLKGRLTRAALALLTLGFGIFLASFGASLIYAAFSLVAGFLLAPRQRA
jgi:multisubunit Na+/H+ antiporter MnhE subunit